METSKTEQEVDLTEEEQKMKSTIEKKYQYHI